MFVFKKSTISWLLINIVNDVTGLGVTGLAFNAAGLSFKLAKSSAAAATKTLSAPDWVEVANGWYWVRISAAETDTAGVGLLIAIYNGDEAGYPFDVHSNLEEDVFARVGAPAGASVSADVAAVKVDTGLTSTRLGTPVGASISADIAAVKVDTAAMVVALPKMLGLADENTVRDLLVYSGTDLTSARIRAYDSAANATAAGATGLLYTWTVTATYSAPGVLATFKVVLV